jgi:outer membrane protein assembly factor BamB
MNKFFKGFGTAVLLFSIVVSALGTTRYVIWWKEKSSSRKNVAALDLPTGKAIWQKQLPDVLSFVEEQPEGILVGCDDKSLYLLSATDGAQIWKVSLGKEVNEFHGSSAEGFLVSHDKAVYWLVSRDGKVVHAWRS